MSWGSAFFTAVQPSLRTLNNSQLLWERHHIQQLLILLDSLETPGCNGYNYELMALNSPSDLMPSSPACFLFLFCLLIAVPQLFVISHLSWKHQLYFLLFSSKKLLPAPSFLLFTVFHHSFPCLNLISFVLLWKVVFFFPIRGIKHRSECAQEMCVTQLMLPAPGGCLFPALQLSPLGRGQH